jgi:hypothetical protein
VPGAFKPHKQAERSLSRGIEAAKKQNSMLEL